MLKQLIIIIMIFICGNESRVVKRHKPVYGHNINEKHTNKNNQVQPCVFEFNSSLISQGEVFSPNYPNPYPNNLNCRYEFYGKENERVIIYVDEFDLEPPQSSSQNGLDLIDMVETVTRANSASSTKNFLFQSSNEISFGSQPIEYSSSNRQCFYDFLDVFSVDGQGRTYWQSRHCGKQIDSKLVSTSPFLFLVFQTDRMLNFKGFKLRFHFSYLNILPFITQKICGESELQGNGSKIESPFYPMAFPVNTECAWTITVPKNQQILIKFIDVNFNQPCKQTSIQIWDGYVSNINKPDKLVCEKLAYYNRGVLQFKSKTNRIVIRFLGSRESSIEKATDSLFSSTPVNLQKTNRRNFQNGFLLSWTAVQITNNCMEFQCKGGEYCIDSKSFLCQKTESFCISKNLVCDGILNCDIGDESDEAHCELKYLKSKLYLSITIITSVTFALLTFVCLIIHIINKKRQNRINKSEANNEEDEQTKINLVMPTPMFPNITNDEYEQKPNENYLASNALDDQSVEFIQSRRFKCKNNSFKNSKQDIETKETLANISQSGLDNPNWSKKTRKFEIRPKATNSICNSERKDSQLNELNQDEQLHHLLSEDEKFATLRRNSYTKAIFLEDEI
jgi:hypothetical protein